MSFINYHSCFPNFKVDKHQEAGDPHLQQIFQVFSSFHLFYQQQCCMKIVTPTTSQFTSIMKLPLTRDCNMILQDQDGKCLPGDDGHCL